MHSVRLTPTMSRAGTSQDGKKSDHRAGSIVWLDGSSGAVGQLCLEIGRWAQDFNSCQPPKVVRIEIYPVSALDRDRLAMADTYDVLLREVQRLWRVYVDVTSIG